MKNYLFKRFLIILILIIPILISTPKEASASGEFITTWKTDNTGTSASNQITIPTIGSGYNYTVDWGDSNSDTAVTGNITHTYAVAGTYTVMITGSFPRIYFDLGGDKNKILSVEQWGSISWVSMESAFQGCSNLVVNAIDVPDLTLVTDMGSMFSEATSFNSNINNWNVSNVTNMNKLFWGATLFNQPLNSWNVSKVTDMVGILAGRYNAYNIFNQDISSWDVSSVTNMEAMFVFSAFNQPLDSWNVSNVTNMTSMFSSTPFNKPLNSWNVANVTQMDRMFQGAPFNQDISSWNVLKVTNMSYMFSGDSAFNQPLNSWNVSNVTNMSYMFSGASAFNQPLNSWNVSKVTDMSYLFGSMYGTTSFNQDITSWDVSSVTNMAYMFAGMTSFNQNITAWNSTAKVTNMAGMFKSTSFNQDISAWNVSLVTDMSSMFESTPFNQNISSWNVANVTNMEAMFKAANSFNQPIGSWNVAKVTNMREMFSANHIFNQPIGSWNVGFVTTMQSMFDSSVFNQDISSWDVSKVTNMRWLFSYNSAFNQPIGSWNVSNVTTMYSMFSNTSAFNQPLNNWNVSNVADMGYMFSNITLSTANYDALLTGWSALTLKPSVTLNGGSSKYCNAETQRQSIITNYSWTITDGGLNCPLAVPVLTTEVATSLTTTTATLNGDITSTSGVSPTDRGFEYGITTSYGTTTTENGSFTTGAFTSSISSLTCSTTYHYRAYATNTTGTGYGNDQEFTTSACQTISAPAITGITIPVTGATPTATIADTTEYTATISWTPADGTFQANTVYAANIEITPKSGYTLTGVTADFFIVNGATTTNTIDSGVVSAEFPATQLFSIGESFQGGKIAYILQAGDPGYINDGIVRGLIAAPTDTGGMWVDGYNFPVTGASGTAIGTGEANTNIIVSVQGTTGSYVGLTIYNSTLNGYSDWYLPSKDELNKLYLNKDLIGGFGIYRYFSSSETESQYTWTQLFETGEVNAYYKHNGYASRAVRSFTNGVSSLPVISGVTQPVTGATPATTTLETDRYTGSISWSGNPTKFIAGVAYTATITLTPKTKYTLVGTPINNFTVAGATSVTNDENSGTITAVFPTTIATATPTLDNETAFSTTKTTTTLSGIITNTGGENATVRGFDYGLDTSYGITTTENGTFGNGIFIKSISSLACSTTYHYRAYATNPAGTGYGVDQTFATSDCASIENYGWTSRINAGKHSWKSISSSFDGTKLAAVFQGDYIYTSTDSGNTWTAQTNSGQRQWVSVTSSADGTKLAAVPSFGYIYTSTDSGITWTERSGAGSNPWSQIVSSWNGNKLVAINYNNGYIYTSTDSGITWTAQTNSGQRQWYGVTSSADGTKLAAVDYNNGYIYTSTDSGNTWTAQTSGGQHQWYSISSSWDGTKLVAAAYNNYIYTSTDSGITWTARTELGQKYWYTVSSSFDGTKLVAGPMFNNYIYTSTDSGNTWTTQTGAGQHNWYSVSTSYDGLKISTVDNNSGYIYTYNIINSAPSVRVETSLALNASTIRITGYVNTDNTTRGFQYGLDTNYGQTITQNGSYNLGSFTSDISNITPNTVYHYRVYATNAFGTTYSEDSTFKLQFQNWVVKTNSGQRYWNAMEASSDGTKLVAADQNNGYLYTSTDSGNTWTAQTSGGQHQWYDLASSSDGTKLAAIVAGGYMYTSTDSGLTWINRTAVNRNWRSVTSSADGTKLAAVISNNYVYTSTDSGLNWTSQSNSGSRSWSSIRSSADGTKLAAVVTGGYIYTSIDSGINWTEQTSLGQQPWQKVSYSSDGSKIALIPSFGYIYISSDGGISWVEQTSAGQRYWDDIKISSDGSKIIAVDPSNGYIYTSTDGGAIWTAQISAGQRQWYAVTSSDDGTKIFAAVYYDYIYTSSPTSTSSLSTEIASSVTTDSVILNGTITSTGGATPSVRGFNYGLDTNYGTTTTENGSFTTGAFTSSISSLTCSTTYHYRAYATNVMGMGYGNDQTFTTGTCPTIISNPAISGITIPVTGATPTSTIADTTEYTATISWTPADGTFQGGTVYTANIEITPKSGYTLTGVTADFFTVDGATTTNTIDSGVVSAVFPATQIVVQESDKFITTWKTDNSGTSASNQITIPTTGGGYNYTVDWGDGNTNSGVTGNITHTYAVAGTYTVKIYGTFPQIYFGGGIDADKILSVEQWGANIWRSMHAAFSGTSNLVINATDAPDLSVTTDMGNMFGSANSFNQDISFWNVSNITDMSNMFIYNTSFNQPLNNWDVSNLTITDGMFYGASSFNQPLSSWNVSKLVSMRYMFDYNPSFNQDISTWDVSNATYMTGMFYGASSFDQNLSNWNISNVTDMTVMFKDSGLSSSNYDAILNSWSVLTLKSGVPFDAGATKYCSSAAARVNIINTYGWTILDGGFYCPTVAISNPAISGITIPVTGATPTSTIADTTEYTATISWTPADGTFQGGTVYTANIEITPKSGYTLTGVTADFFTVDGATTTNTIDSGVVSAVFPATQIIVQESDKFITTWRTTTNGESITIPIYSGETYNYTVDWGDGNTNTGLTGNATHSYATAGIHTVAIYETFPRICFYCGGNAQQIISVEQWGSNIWSSMNFAFFGASNLVVNATDIPDLSIATNLGGMFYNATSFNSDISNWDVSNITSMSSLFANNVSFNQDISNWNVSNVTDTGSMFYGATSFNQPLNSWNVAKVTHMGGMFSGATSFNQPLNSWNVSNVTNMLDMFRLSTSFNQDISNWNVSKTTVMSNMFNGVTLSTSNYDSLLNSWSVQSLKPNVNFNGGNSKYSSSALAARNILTSAPNSWIIVDGGLSASPSIISAPAISGITVPVTGATPTSTIADTTEYTATISWTPADGTFQANTIYIANINITPKSEYTLTGVPANFFTVAGATTTNTIGSGVVSAEFPATASDLSTYNTVLSAVTESDYTTDSWAIYQSIVEANIMTNENSQAEIDTATANITAAQGDLVLLPAPSDTTPPTFGVSIGNSGKPGETTKIGITVNDNISIASAEISFDSGNTFISMTETPESITRNNPQQRRYTYNKDIPLNQETNIDYQIKATDSDGNISTVEKIMIISIVVNSEYSSSPNEQALFPNNSVFSSVVSKNGTVYIGGEFNQVGENNRNHIAAFNPNGTISTFNPDIDGTVYSLALSKDESILYVGGMFNNINGTTRNYLASFKTSDGTLTNWNPNLSSNDGQGGRVAQMIISPDGNTMYISGGFSRVGLISRSHIAALNISNPLTPALKSLNAGYIDGGVPAIALSPDNSILYLGGAFSSINGVTRGYLASINISNGSLTEFNPMLNDTVSGLLLSKDGSTLYAEGGFDYINSGNDNRNNLASFNTIDGSLTNFNPNINGSSWNSDRMMIISPDDSTLFVGGEFNQIGTTEIRNNIASFRISDGTLTNFNPVFNSEVNTLSFSPDGSTLYVGGMFNTLEGSDGYQYFVSFNGPKTLTIPNIETTNVSQITTTSVILNANLVSTGEPKSTSRGFNYGLTNNYGQNISENGLFENGDYFASISSLTCSTTYHYQAYATNTTGIGYGEDKTFTTKSCHVSGGGGGTSSGSRGDSSSSKIITTIPIIKQPEVGTGLSFIFKITFKIGAKIIDVKELQLILIKKGYLTGIADGIFGKGTLAAVIKFQKDNGLVSDGIVGPATRALLNKLSISTITPPVITPALPTETSTTLKLTQLLRYGSKLNNANEVKMLQIILIKKGLLTEGTADGIFGKATLTAVKKFQLDNNLTPDGIVGAGTRKVING